MRLLKWVALIVALLGLAVPVLAQDENVLELGAAVEGSLNPEQPFVDYTFVLEDEQTVTVTLTASEFDTYLFLYDADGIELAGDDDSAGSLDSRIGPITLDAGTYTVRATSYSYRSNASSDAEGDFTLLAELFQTRSIEYTQRVEGELTDDELMTAFSFRGQAGDTVLIRLESDDFDSYLTLNDAAGTELTYNDDGAGSLNSLIGPYKLPETGEYIIQVTSFGGSETGSYVLTLDRVELIELEYGDAVEVTFDGQTRAFYFSFEGSAGDAVTISADSDGTIDTSLTLLDSVNYSLTSDADGGSGFDPEIHNYLLVSGGTYTIQLDSELRGEGTVTLMLERGELPSLDEGAQTLRFNDQRTRNSLRFTGVAGERVTIVVTSGSGLISPSFDIVQDGNFLSYTSATDVVEMSFTFDIDVDGEVIVTVNEYSYSRASLTVELIRE